MGIEDRLDLNWIDIEAEMDDQFFGAAYNKNISVLDFCQVARVEPSLRIDHCRSLFGCFVIALHDIRTPNPQFPNFSVREGHSVCVDDPNFNSGKCATD